jgi:hypothetical protein
MRIRIIKPPPAYVIDGFDVGGMSAGHIYDVDARMAKYLVVAGLAVPVDDDDSNPAKSGGSDTGSS